MKSLVTCSLWPCNLSQNGNQLASCIIFTDLGHSWTHCRLSGSTLHKNPLGLLFLVILHEPRIHSCAQNKTLLQNTRLQWIWASIQKPYVYGHSTAWTILSLWWSMGFNTCLMKLFPPVYKPYHVPSLHDYNNQKLLKPHIMNPIKLATGSAAMFFHFFICCQFITKLFFIISFASIQIHNLWEINDLSAYCGLKESIAKNHKRKLG